MSDIAKFLRYFLVGGASYIFVTGLTYVLHVYFSVSESEAFLVSLVLASLINAFVLKFYVFRSGVRLIRSGLGFLLVSFSMRGVEFLIFYSLFRMGLYYLVASTVAMAIGAISKYFLIKIFVYKS